MKISRLKSERKRPQRGYALGMAMVILLAVSLLASGILRLSDTHAVETAKSVSNHQAFWDAEAGLHESMAVALKNKDAGEDLVFPTSHPRTWTGTTGTGSYLVDVQDAVGFADPAFLVTSDGTSLGAVTRTVETFIQQLPAISVGAFGNLELALQPNMSIYSYYSSTTTNPTPSDSTGEATIGSNEQVDLQPGITLDGTIILGQDEDGVPADCSGCGPYNSEETDYIEPDPLGINGGWLADLFSAAQTANNNAAVPQITGTELDVGNGETATIPAGDYYLTNVEIKGDLVINATNGIVNFFVSGPVKSWPGCHINVGGRPVNFRIYSDSTASIDLQPDNDFGAFLYAPNSEELKVRPNGDFHGAVWAKNVTFQPGGSIYVDMDLLEYETFETYRVQSASWRLLPQT